MGADARIRGGFLGHAVGDALGFPYEGRSREEMRAHPVEDMPPDPVLSDDTAMVVCTAESLCERGEDVEDLARRFLMWLHGGECTPHGRAVGVGRTTLLSLKRVASGVPPLEAGGRGERDNGNGSLMRMLPLVFYLYGEGDGRVLEVVRLYSSITHAHPRSILGCHLYVLMGMALYGGSPPMEAYRITISKVGDMWRGHPETEHYARVLGGRIDELPEEEIRSSGYVVHTVEAAFWVLLRTDSFREAVLKAVSLGGDTDTLAAVVGGLAGIHYTDASIPPKWLARLPMRERLEELARCFSERWGANKTLQ